MTTIQIRKDTVSNWTLVNPILADGEQGYETDTGKMKIGDGVTEWNTLGYFADTSGLSSDWGTITGTLSNQTDLQLELDNKVDDTQVLTDVPAGAVFTDTIYNDSPIQAEVDLNTAKISYTDAALVAQHTTDISNNTTAISGKSDSNHTHSGVYEPVFTKNNAFNKNFGTATNTLIHGNDTRLSDSRTPVSHNQAISTITSLQTSLDAKKDDITLVAITVSRTLVTSDAGKYIRVNTASNTTMTIGTGLNALATGTEIHIRGAGTGTVTIAASGTTISTAETLVLNKQHSTCTLIKVGTSEWDLMGDMVPA